MEYEYRDREWEMWLEGSADDKPVAQMPVRGELDSSTAVEEPDDLPF